MATVNELIKVLTQLKKEGYGDLEVMVGYDSDMATTHTDTEYEIIIGEKNIDDYIRFQGD